MADDEDADGTNGLFQEPEGYYQPEKEAKTVSYHTLSGQTISLRLVGHSPLWGHLLWNAGRTVADYLEQNGETLIRGRTVLELGAGAGLPSIISALQGATTVVVSDYPEAELVENLRLNIEQNCIGRDVHVEGYLWGASPAALLQSLPESDRTLGFDLIILADLLFNHSEHAKLVASVQQTLKETSTACALVFFTPYRPWLLEKDLAFFELAREAGFVVDKILEHVMDRVMFEEDRGDELLRRTVFGYSLRW
ncbi:hypothetical protein BAUCODRAFT_120564 [Baudoinia panamericana UAMH 10762]|uniref:Protein N-terminal and lysine N-methyltransferase EFM7 n=1 Tax=Baudoinia panamericana (strain UAMH 10762) TaxID=717646 RepID=M2MR23_BAUPA|nr:uncharacterized protein BAUCODRAFT_120564 [Baudoinia panamericana UAMH 10762]EMC99291.1 hypothetical protein BAUCODRAFT_120564 [Baudoinia panamericana UAMH 10762]